LYGDIIMAPRLLVAIKKRCLHMYLLVNVRILNNYFKILYFIILIL